MVDSGRPEVHAPDVASSERTTLRTADPTPTALNGFLTTMDLLLVEEELESIEEPFGVEEFRGIFVGVKDALRWLDGVDLNVVFQRKTNVIRSVPHFFLQSPFRNAMKVLIEEIVAGHERHAKAANAPHEGLLKSERGTSRVSVKASLAFGRHSHTNTDFIVCHIPTVFFPICVF